MKTTKLVIIGLMLLLGGCATENARMGLFSAEADVLGMLRDDLFAGKAIGYLDRTGTIDIYSVLDTSRKCVGEFRYTGSKTGVGRITCNDGEIAEFQFIGVTSLSGYGFGRSTRGGFSFTFGMGIDEAKSHLRLPKNKAIKKTKDGPRLYKVDI